MDYSLALPMLPADHFIPLARQAEAVGFTSIAVPESVFFPRLAEKHRMEAEAQEGSGRLG